MIALIQARMGASRLPNKVMLGLRDRTVLEVVVGRVKKVLDFMVVTSDSKRDDVIEDLCLDRGYNYFRGNEDDVLDRYYKCARKYLIKDIVRITSDCPLVDGGIIREVVDKYCGGFDYSSNLMPRTYPRGLDVEVVRFDVLEERWKRDTENRQHVTLGIRTNPEKFKIGNVRNDVDYSYMRWTLDDVEDYRFLRKVYELFPDASWKDIIYYLEDHPEMVIRDHSPILEVVR